MSESNGHTPEDSDGIHEEYAALVTESKALKSQLASIRKLCEAGWPRGEACRLCKQVGSHTQNCYVRNSVGYDLLEEHEETVRENERLRAALAPHLPVVGKHLLQGGQVRSPRDIARGNGRFSKHND